MLVFKASYASAVVGDDVGEGGDVVGAVVGTIVGVVVGAVGMLVGIDVGAVGVEVGAVVGAAQSTFPVAQYRPIPGLLTHWEPFQHGLRSVHGHELGMGWYHSSHSSHCVVMPARRFPHAEQNRPRTRVYG